uniref:Uncharacterized protein n=1 Tax=Hammarskog virga-like virus TaxID=2665440 RepID=A0A5Q0V1Q7_9VIRU|nr:hypothetical protein [Hammarskog virga-like virus]
MLWSLTLLLLRVVSARNVRLDFGTQRPEFSLLVNLKPVTEPGPACIKAVVNGECFLPDFCSPIIRYHKHIGQQVVLICAGYRSARSIEPVLEKFEAYPIDSVLQVTPKELYFVLVSPLGGAPTHALIIPLAILRLLAAQSEPPHEFYVDPELRVCAYGSFLPQISTFLQRRIPVLTNNVTLINPPFVTHETEISCKRPFRDATCPNMIILNRTHGLCAHTWVRVIPEYLCPRDFEYRHGFFTLPDICVNITQPETKPTLQVNYDDSWLQKNLKLVIMWFIDSAEVVVNFIENCFLKLLRKMTAFIFQELAQLQKYLEAFDAEYVMFEMLLLLTFITYRSNIHAAILLVVVFGLVCGYSRTMDFRLLKTIQFTSDSEDLNKIKFVP